VNEADLENAIYAEIEKKKKKELAKQNCKSKTKINGVLRPSRNHQR
jgi:Mor family transcriptional regulator